MKAFNNGIKKVIHKFEYPFYIVQQDFNIDCVCKDYTTKQGNPTCKKCLGLGHKIKIKQIRGASQDRRGTFKNTGLMENSLSTVYYIDSKYTVFEDNIIVDDNEVFVIYRLERKKSSNKEEIYRKILAHYLKGNPKLFLKNFKELIKGVDSK